MGGRKVRPDARPVPEWDSFGTGFFVPTTKIGYRHN
jgi:hypothetical protein